MDRDVALRQIDDPDSDVRLRAARVLAHSALPNDESVIRRRRRVESVPWVRSALESALRRLSAREDATVETTECEGELDSSHVARTYLASIELVTDRIIHELRSIVGTLRYWAEKEHSSFEGSQTERQVGRLRQCLEAIDLLGKVSRTPSTDEFDLVRLVDDEVGAIEEVGANVTMIGSRPFIVRGDRGVLSLVLRNALRNAAEAFVESPTQIHINWGDTSSHYWVAVFDRGLGLPREPEALFDFGSSTKRGHVGAGLAIVAQAAIAIGGDVSLSEEADGTTKFQFRWPRTA